MQLTPTAKHRLFSIILLITPFLFLLMLEGGLRFFSYGVDLALVHRTTVRGRDFLTINRSVARRYFSQPGVAIPEPPDVLFSVRKAARTKRVFCLGESTMAGFPYEYNATPASLLKDQLTALLPADTIEVINIGLSAVGSTVVRDLLTDILPYEPDLVVIYVGHNEFYGVFGPGSSSPLSGPGWLTRLHLRLVRTRSYQLMQDLYGWADAAIHRGRRGTDATLMEEMGNRTGIPLHGQVYEQGRATYRENLEAIIREARAHHLPLLFSTLVVNLRDQTPFASAFTPGTDAPTREAITGLLAQATTALASRATDDAVDMLRRAVVLDSSYALARFRLGQALLASGDTAAAGREFSAARDLDPIRFRATEEFQHTLLAVCTAEGAPVARTDSAFARVSPGGITGHDLILEHLHPNIRGYALMAKTWASAIRDRELLAPQNAHGPLLPDSAWTTVAAVTTFDDAIGEIKTEQLTSRWPFTPDQQQHPPALTDTVRMIVARALREHTAWTRARYSVAEWYEHRKDFARARQEYAAIAKALPYSFQPIVRQADASAAEGRMADAIAGYRRSILVEENPYAHMKMGVLLLQNADTQAAMAELERGLAVDATQGGSLTTGEQAFGRSLLAYAYARSGRYDAAREQARKALALQPGLKEAAELLRRLP